jgi:methyl coenzyme M reductase subunit D
MEKQYNGWTNNATWRIMVDILSDIEFNEHVTVDKLKEIVDDMVFSDYEMKSGSHLIEDYANAFISQVNFYEIAESINEEIDLQAEHED